MSTRINTGFRIAGAGAATGAIVALATTSAAFAQPPLTGFEAEFLLFSPDGRPTVDSVLTQDGQAAAIALEFAPEAAPGITTIEVEVDFSETEGYLVPATTDADCTLDRMLLVCSAENTGGTFDSGTAQFDFSIGLGPDADADTAASFFVDVAITTADQTSTESYSELLTFDASLFESAPEEPQVLPDGRPVSELENPDRAFQVSYLDYLYEDATAGATLTAAPLFQVDQTSDLGEDWAGTAVFFSDSVSLDAWFNEEEGVIDYTDDVEAVAAYDNCIDYVGGVTCIVEDLTPQAGTAFEPSADTPVQYSVNGDIEDFGGAYYTAWDLNEATLDLFRRFINLNSDNQFALVEAEPEADPAYQYPHYGMAFFTMGGAEEELPGDRDVEVLDPEAADASEKLPSTGNSSIVLISSAAAALLAGAVVFLLLRRRKTAANWE